MWNVDNNDINIQPPTIKYNLKLSKIARKILNYFFILLRLLFISEYS